MSHSGLAFLTQLTSSFSYQLYALCSMAMCVSFLFCFVCNDWNPVLFPVFGYSEWKGFLCEHMLIFLVINWGPQLLVCVGIAFFLRSWQAFPEWPLRNPTCSMWPFQFLCFFGSTWCSLDLFFFLMDWLKWRQKPQMNQNQINKYSNNSKEGARSHWALPSHSLWGFSGEGVGCASL